MDSFTISVIAIFAAAIIFSILPKSRRQTDLVDINAGANDPELVGPVTITRNVEYPGSRQHEGGSAIVRYDTTYSGGGLRVSKWILASHGLYLTGRGHHVLYEYRREDGSLESDRLVFPDATLGGGIYVKQRLRFFNQQKELLKEHYLREDGTIGLISDEVTRVFQHFRLDGRTLHSEYFSTVEVGQRSVFYRLDGTTVWMEKDEKGNARVYFDLDGNAVDLRFTRENVIGSYGMGPQSKPLLTSYDNYHREDGTLAYKQAWYVRWDKTLDSSVDTLGGVVVYDASGTKPVAEYTLDLRAAGQPCLIKQRQDLVNPRSFDGNDSFKGNVKDIIFQGFIRNVWGTYDDESHDI